MPEPFFTAARGPASFSFGVISDTQKGYNIHATLVKRLVGQHIRFLLNAGDLVQIGSSEPDWLDFFSAEAPLLKNVPLFPAPGNHDNVGFDDFFARYFPPDSSDPTPPALRGYVYSFDYGPCHFISLDINLLIKPGFPEYDWLVSDLAAADLDPARKFTVVFIHFPPLSGFAYGQYSDGLNYLVPLFAAHGVDAVFSGHVHIYERSVANGTVYITCARGGGDPRAWWPEPALNPYEQAWRFGAGFIRVDVAEDSLDFFAFDEQGRLFDRYHYAKP